MKKEMIQIMIDNYKGIESTLNNFIIKVIVFVLQLNFMKRLMKEI